MAPFVWLSFEAALPTFDSDSCQSCGDVMAVAEGSCDVRSLAHRFGVDASVLACEADVFVVADAMDVHVAVSSASA